MLDSIFQKQLNIAVGWSFGKKSVLTVSGLGSRILCINDVAAGENQKGHENCAAFICTMTKYLGHFNTAQDKL